MVISTRSRAILAALVAGLAILLAAAHPASAEPPEGEALRAQALFTSGRAALERGDHAAACAALSESLAIVVRSNTLFNLAQCEEHGGKLVDARRHWQQGLELLPPEDERIALAKRRVEALGRRLPRLSIQVAGDAPAETRVELDGHPLAPAALAQPIAIDPGAHVLALHAPGHAARRLDITVAEGETRSVLLSLSTRDAPRAALTPAPRSRPIVGWVLGGLGVAGLAVAAATGAILVARHGAIDDACPDKLCTAEGRRLIDGTRPLNVVNAAGFIMGAAGLGAGALVLLLGGRAAPSAAVAPVAGGGVFLVTGSF